MGLRSLRSNGISLSSSFDRRENFFARRRIELVAIEREEQALANRHRGGLVVLLPEGRFDERPMNGELK